MVPDVEFGEVDGAGGARLLGGEARRQVIAPGLVPVAEEDVSASTICQRDCRGSYSLGAACEGGEKETLSAVRPGDTQTTAMRRASP